VRAYYNDNNAYCAQWLRNLIEKGLIADGDVDDRDIRDVRPEDLRGYRQVHFFAGLGGWPYALRLAEWPGDREVWTGSCPCQPLSVAGRREGHADERHLWPAFHSLIASRRPAILFGEQVASKDGREWLGAVRADLEGSGYAVGAADIPAAGVGAPHIRQRLWFVANATAMQRPAVIGGEPDGDHARAGDLADAARDGRRSRRESDTTQEPEGRQSGGSGIGTNFRDANVSGLAIRQGQSRDVGEECKAALGTGWWHAEPDVGRVADGIPARVDKLRALGNAIVPQVAVEFIRASLGAIADVA
jgi:DNA (cytosine-5)-methyltransferase 1